MKKIILIIFGFILFCTGCGKQSGYIKNGKYYLDDNNYIKIDGTSVEIYDTENYLEAYGEYEEDDGIITITYTFRNELDKSSDEYGSVVPYNRLDTAHLEDDTIVIDSIKIDNHELEAEYKYTLK